MDIRLNDEQTMIRETVRDIARERIAPRAAEIDRSGEFPWDVVDLFRKHDLFALPFPPEYGGLSGSALTLNVAIEEVAKVCATSALILTVQASRWIPLDDRGDRRTEGATASGPGERSEAQRVCAQRARCRQRPGGHGDARGTSRR